MKNNIILLNTIPDKKTKSIGNRCLIPINREKNILDYHINTIYKIFKNSKIIFVNSLDSKKIKKYIQYKYKNIEYIEHEYCEKNNIGLGLKLALNTITNNNNCLIMNTNIILHQSAMNKIKQSINTSFVMYTEDKGQVGIVYNNEDLINCYYGLPNNLFDLIYINSHQFKKINKNIEISNLYLFEIINEYISQGLKIKPIKINKSSITIINSTKNIEKVKKKICLI
jgi:hypothetical protein